MQTYTIGNPASDPVDDLATCQAALRRAGWWETADLTERWPLTTAEAVHLLSAAGEYELSEAGLVELVERGLLPAPSTGEGREYEWDAADVIAASGIFEMRSQYRPTPSRNDAKKHPCQLALELARTEGTVGGIAAPRGGLPRIDAIHALALLRNCDSREGREKLVALLKAVLEVEHGVLIP
jgi:hypothetical protein